MRKRKLGFGEKNILLLMGSVAFSMLFAFGFLHFLYKDLYLNTIRESVETQGQRTATHYHYGELTEDIIEKIHWYNVVSDYEVIVVNQLDELNTSFPYKIGKTNLLEESEREALMNGEPIMKEGYVEHFERDVIGAIYPITDGSAPIGFIFIYVPLAGLSQVFTTSIPILLVGGLLFFVGMAYLINRIRKSLFKPLDSLQEMSREVSKGNFTNRLTVKQLDEIGQMSMAFNEMTEALQHQEEQKREFLSNVVHELRTPLTYIMGYAEIVKNGLYTSEEEEKKYLETIELEVKRLKKLLADLAELTYLQDEFYHFQREPIAVGQLLYDTAELFRHLASEKGIGYHFQVNEEVIIVNDPKRIQQVFYNLIDNAIKYAYADSVIEYVLKETDGCLSFEITNKGPTLSEEEIKQLGQRFFRTDKARTRHTGGTGLGLSIVKEIIQLQNGTLEIFNGGGERVTFKVILPLENEQIAKEERGRK